MASLTKPIATASAILLLAQEGRIDLAAPIEQYVPEFGGRGKGAITVEQLLRHTSGLPPVAPVKCMSSGRQNALDCIAGLPLRHPPGTKHLYSDLGYIVLAWAAESVSQMPFDRFVKERIYQPLGMNDTGFLRLGEKVPGATRDRCVPTNPRGFEDRSLRCAVHDPRAHALGGVAGHAGLFSSGADLARFAEAMAPVAEAHDDHSAGVPPAPPLFLSADWIHAMTTGSMDAVPPWGLGWQLWNGERVGGGPDWPHSAFWHLGFTGTMLWVDPESGVFLIVLGDRAAVKPTGNLMDLRRKSVAAVLAAVEDAPWKAAFKTAGTGLVRTGLDRLADGDWPEVLRGRRVALITNQTGRDRLGRSAADILAGSGLCELVSILTPEHGLQGTRTGPVADAQDPGWGVPIFSLFGPRSAPDARSMRNANAIVLDLQDSGARFYTYASTMVAALDYAARQGIPLVVLDRPNPLGGVRVEGPVADSAALDFVGILPVPIRHGLTMGELARLAARLRGRQVRLEVVAMEGWHRRMLFEETGVPWIAPSPNMRTPTTALVYPGIGLLETTNLSVGRGTPHPFERVGAPWMDADRMAKAMNGLGLPGVGFRPTTFVPDSGPFHGRTCHGLGIEVTDVETFQPVRMGIAIASTLARLHPRDWDSRRLGRLLKNRDVQSALLRGDTLETVFRRIAGDEQRFDEVRAPVLLYP